MRYKGIELHSDEEVKGVFREFTARLILPFTISSIFIITPFYFFVPLWNLHLWNWDIHSVGRGLFYFLLAFGVLYGIRAWVIWSGTMLITTNQRIVDVDRRGLFDKIVSEIPFESLSDVSYRSKGFIEMTANVGTITFQLFSGNANISFGHIINPAALHKHVLELRVAYTRGTPVVDDPVESVTNRIGKFSPTEQRALLANLKKTVPRRAPKGVTKNDFDPDLT